MKGFLILPVIMIGLIFLFLIGGGVVLITQIPILKLLFQFYMIVVIFGFVRAIMGTGALAYVITGILAYIFVIRLFTMVTGVWLTFLIMSFGLSGMIVFGLQGIWGHQKFKKF